MSRPDLTPSLIQDLRQGSPDAAELLDHLYRDAMVRLAWGYLGDLADAEDAAQEIFCKVLETDQVPDNFRAWLYRVARNHCLNMRRGRGRRKDRARLSTHAEVAASGLGQLSRLVAAERGEQVADLLASLPDPQQEVLRLRYAEGLSRGEIAEVLEIPASLVKTRLFEAMKKLRASASPPSTA